MSALSGAARLAMETEVERLQRCCREKDTRIAEAEREVSRLRVLLARLNASHREAREQMLAGIDRAVPLLGDVLP